MSISKKKPASVPANTVTGSASLAQRVRSANRWRDQFNPLRGLTLARAVALGEAYFRGEMAELQWAYFWIEGTDPDLLALLECRFGRLLEMEYNIQSTEDADKKLAEDQRVFLQERFERIDNLYEAIEHLGMAAFRGFSHCEKWHDSAGVLTHLEIVDQWNVVRDGLVGGWKYNPDARVASFASLSADAEMPAENFLFRQVRRPINRIALLKFVRASLSDKDWDAFIEIYGIPSGVVVGPPNVPIDQAAVYQAAAQAVAEGGSGYLPHGSDYKTNDSPRGTEPFKTRLDHLSEKLVLAGTGGKLTMLTEAGSGTLAGGAHADVFAQIAAGEARRISEAINRQLVLPMLQEEFQGRKQVAYFKLAANEETDVGDIVEHITKLKTAGYVVEADEVSEKTGYTVTLAAPAEPKFDSSSNAGPFANRFRNRADHGRAAVFQANAAAQDLAAKRPVFAPLAKRLALIMSATDEASFSAAASTLRAESGRLYRDIIAAAPELAKPAEDAIGAALVSGFAEAAQAKKEGS